MVPVMLRKAWYLFFVWCFTTSEQLVSGKWKVVFDAALDEAVAPPLSIGGGRGGGGYSQLLSCFLRYIFSSCFVQHVISSTNVILCFDVFLFSSFLTSP